ncbi:MAG: methyltransferase domain-containing protein [Streptosporangiales bacterium]|nr:methyltransferase domain-containing protein [Streptosporangiales bacterium]
MNDQQLAQLLGIGSPWREAMIAVPRARFVPARGLASPEHGIPYPIDRDARPEQWHTAVYSDASIITQRADGAAAPDDTAAGPASSSISAPGIAFSFLQLLGPAEGDRVLEIGTGTGYTAALLSHLLSAENVTTLEVDPALAAQAEANLKAVGLTPHVIAGDGADGYPPDAPYDRVHVTCAVASIAYTWVEQARPGAVIVAPWQPQIGHGHKTRLTVTDSGTAHGRFHGPSGYMMLRNHRAELAWRPHHQQDAVTSTTRLDLRRIQHAGPGLNLAVTARAPGLGFFVEEDPGDGSVSLLCYEIGNPAGPWAACDYQPGHATHPVTQHGPRRLWDELEDTFTWWTRNDSPAPGRYGLTVAASGEEPWLDQPSHIITP